MSKKSKAQHCGGWTSSKILLEIKNKFWFLSFLCDFSQLSVVLLSLTFILIFLADVVGSACA